MKTIAIAAALAVGSTLAMAQAAGGASGDAGVGNTSDPHVGEYWSKNAKDGFMTRDQAMGYRTKDGKAWADKSGKPMDYTTMDKDGDGRVSRAEWTGYHGGGNAPVSPASATPGAAGNEASSGAGSPAGSPGSPAR